MIDTEKKRTVNEKYNIYEKNILEYARKNYRKMFREPDGNLRYPFIVPGSCYHNCLWDWDSWLTNIALAHIVEDEDISEYEKGCILNFLEHIDEKGRMPIAIQPDSTLPKFEADNGHF